MLVQLVMELWLLLWIKVNIAIVAEEKSYLLSVYRYTNESLHSPSLLILSAPLTLKECTTPICSDSVMYCDVVMLVKLVLVAVTST